MSAVSFVERHILRATIKALLDAGFYLSVEDGCEWIITLSRDAEAVFEATRSAQTEWLYADRSPNNGIAGDRWVKLVYGNDGWDVISDYTTNLEEALKPVNELAVRISEGRD